MQHKQTHHHESGQAIILVAAAMVALLAMLGLAIDGGNIYFLNRDLQNASDAAIVSAAYTKCAGGSEAQIRNAVLAAASQNGFEHGVDGVVITVNNPPVSGSAAGNSDYVEVIIQAEQQPYFIQIVRGNEPLQVRARGVGRCNPSTGGANGRALFAMADGCGPWNLNLAGSSSTIVGGAHSNNGFKSTGASHSFTGTTSYVGGFNSGASFNPAPATSSVLPSPVNFSLSTYDIDAGGARAAEAQAAGRYIKYYGDSPMLTEAHLSQYDLIYAEGDISISAKTKGTYTATFVAEGNISMQQGNGKDLHLAAAYDHLLFFANNDGNPSCNTKSIKLSLSGASWEGIMYAPHGEADLSMSGNSSFDGSIVAYTLSISAANSTIIYNPDFIPPTPPDISISE